MVVEDEPDLRELYDAYLEDSYQVISAAGGSEALDLLNDDVDVILLDRRMPEMSGDEIIDEINEHGNHRIAMVTAVTPQTDIIDMPFDEYLVKPVSQKELLSTVERLLNLDRYDETMQEFMSLVKKRALLLDELKEEELSKNAEFQRLTDDIAQLESELETLRHRIDPDQELAFFENL